MADIFEQLKNAKSVGISGHLRPDGDCIGSCLGLYLYLKKRMPDTFIKIYLEKPDSCFDGVPAIDAIDYDFTDEGVFDVFIAVDTVPERMGDAYKFFQTAKYKINIDHHVSNPGEAADINYIDSAAAASGIVVYRLLDTQYIDADIATLIYMAIAHDTGIFRFSNTTPETMRIVANLLEYEFDFSDLLNKTFFEKTYLQNCVQGQIVLDSELFFDGKVIVGKATREFMDKYGANKNDFDGVVNQLLLTKGVETAIFVYEKAPGVFKFSLRASSDAVNVSKVCQNFGGGGHVRAAGFDYLDDLEKGLGEALELIGKQLNV